MIHDTKSRLLKNPAFSRVAPFAVFMTFIGIEQGLRILQERQTLQFDASVLNWLYLPKAIIVGLLLLYFYKSYTEIVTNHLRNYRMTALSIVSGLLVFILWINMDWTMDIQGSPPGFNPKSIEPEQAKWLLIIVRSAGAVIIVPIMEELFWRSFLLRYLIDTNFKSVDIGKLSMFSFVSVCVLFGLEHHYLFAGIMAGFVFNGIYYYTKSITHCILSHAVANLCLVAYVLNTGNFNFW